MDDGVDQPEANEVEAERVDLAGLGAPTAEREPFDPAPQQERARTLIAYILLALLSFTVIGSLAALGFDWVSIDDLGKYLQLVFAPLIGLVGAVTGFYYGGKSR